MTKQRYRITISHAVQPFEHAKGIIDERELELEDYQFGWLIHGLDLLSAWSKPKSKESE